jgi:hypothetical protein
VAEVVVDIGRRVADGLDPWEDLEEVAQGHRGPVLTSAAVGVLAAVDQATHGNIKRRI